MKKLSVLNRKGGVAKSSLSTTIAIGLAKKGYKILLVDTDPQANSTNVLLPKNKEIKYTPIQDQLRSMKIEPTPTRFENIKMIGSNGNLDSFYTDKIEGSRDVMKEFYLIDTFLKQAEEFDLVVIDTPPTTTDLTTHVLYASDLSIIPIANDINALDGMETMIDEIQVVSEITQKDIRMKILANSIDRTKVDHDLVDTLKEVFGNGMFDTVIKFQKSPMKNATNRRKSIIEYSSSDPTHIVHQWNNLIDEVEEMVWGENKNA